MSAVTSSVPPTESNTARKKKARAEQAAKVTEATPTTPSETAEDKMAASITNGATNGEQNESAYVRELQKQVRNVNKKLNAMSKVDSIVAENPGTSLDDLLASKKINADQKAQALKKPALQAQLAQLDEQLQQYRKIDNEYQSKLAAEKQALKEKYEAEIEDARGTALKEVEANTKKTVRSKLLIFSQFLRTAAAKRAIEEEADTDESKAFEGALLLVYGGDDKAVDAAENIVDGTDEVVPSTEGQPTGIKYSQLKAISFEQSDYVSSDSYDAPTTTNDAGPAILDPTTDPTVANAGLTELGTAAQPIPDATQTNGDTVPSQTSAGDESANKAGGTAVDESEESFEMVPRDPAETDTPHAAPAASVGVTETGAGAGSWADDSAEAAAAVVKQKEDDGFHEVQGRHRGGHKQRGDGEGRGRGRGRGGYRGDRGGERGGRGGYRGERRGGGEGGRGRGRGAPRGGS